MPTSSTAITCAHIIMRQSLVCCGDGVYAVWLYASYDKEKLKGTRKKYIKVLLPTKAGKTMRKL